LAWFFLLLNAKSLMLIRYLLTMAVLSTFCCCDEEIDVQKEEWILTRWHGTSTSCCFDLDEDGTHAENPNPIFNTLLGLEDDGAMETTLLLHDDHSFELLKDGRTALQGSMKRDHRHLRLNGGLHSLDLKILHSTTDSLVMEGKGYECGIRNVKMTFYPSERLN
jgi:hypothetical protein